MKSFVPKAALAAPSCVTMSVRKAWRISTQVMTPSHRLEMTGRRKSWRRQEDTGVTVWLWWKTVLDDKAPRITLVKVYILYIAYTKCVCVQFVHIYTMYSTAVPSSAVWLYSASNCLLFYRQCWSSSLNEEMINLNKCIYIYIKLKVSSILFRIEVKVS